MGACDFFTISDGATAKEAFCRAVEEAQYEYGHGGYTGTIAEKTSFKMVSVPAGEDPIEYAEKLMYEDDYAQAMDKWGPACCVKLSNKKYLFFGSASS